MARPANGVDCVQVGRAKRHSPGCGWGNRVHPAPLPARGPSTAASTWGGCHDPQMPGSPIVPGSPGSPARPPFCRALEGHQGSVLAAASPRQRRQMSSVSVGGKLSVGITGDGCSSVRCSAHERCAGWHGLGSLGPAWPGGPSRVVSRLSQLRSCCSGWGVPPPAVGSPCAVSWLQWAG